MPKDVTPQDMFDLWQKMVNPGAYPLQSLMFPVLDPGELEKKIAELEIVEHWLQANVNMVQLTRRSLQFQLAMLKGGEKAADVLKHPGAAPQDAPAPADKEMDLPNPAMWAWNMMMQDPLKSSPRPAAAATRKPRRKKGA
jgi:hypothetical protein